MPNARHCRSFDIERRGFRLFVRLATLAARKGHMGKYAATDTPMFGGLTHFVVQDTAVGAQLDRRHFRLRLRLVSKLGTAGRSHQQ
jgi:hypothetical protein